MERYQQSYEEALGKNSSEAEKWQKYRKELIETKANLKEFVKSRNVNIMVPVGKKALIRGTLEHTNEITASHGAGMFSDVSSAQATEILDHRISVCDSRLQAIEAERDLFEHKLNIPSDAFIAPEGREIIEEYNEHEERAWRRKHAESVRRQKQIEAEQRQLEAEGEVDVEQMLDEYELMEELTHEIESLDIEDDETFSRVLSGELKIPECKPRVAHNLDSPNNAMEWSSSEEKEPESRHKNVVSSALVARSNREIVELLKAYRSKLKDVLKNVKKEGRNLNLYIDLIEIKDEIENDISKMNDDGVVEEENSETDERDSDDETTASIEVKPEDTKRKVRFSTSLEDIKLIESKSELYENGTDNNTIQIHFQHSAAKFVDPRQGDDDSVAAHPGEIHKLFIKPSTPPAKSILKKKTRDAKSTTAFEEPPVKKIFQSDTQVIGDVFEHKEINPFEVVHVSGKEDAPTKISKFKQMRSKS